MFSLEIKFIITFTWRADQSEQWAAKFRESRKSAAFSDVRPSRVRELREYPLRHCPFWNDSLMHFMHCSENAGIIVLN